MNVTIEKIETFGEGVYAYRIVPDEKEGIFLDSAEPERPIEITENAARLGEELRTQFQNESR